jgi:5-oxoprolinase (ATP-hydrolysing) subunit A
VLNADPHPLLTVDLNCDIGEGIPTDEIIFPFISSANIACGTHAGDSDTMRRSIELAMRHHVAIGAHPSYPDRPDFGRTDILESRPGKGDRPFSFAALPDTLFRQITALRDICKELGTRLHHVKPHGALYNRAAKDPAVSAIIAKTITSIDPDIIIYGLSGSSTKATAEPAAEATTEPAEPAHLQFVNEVFADRTYQPDGSLTPRTRPNALIHDPMTMLSQALNMIKRQQIRTLNGTIIPVITETICLHGDGDQAVAFAKILRTELERNGIAIAAPPFPRSPAPPF